MFPGVNPRDMQKAMKKMGIQQEEIDAVEVIIRLEDRDIIITEPQVSKVKMMGQETYQVMGKAREAARDSKPEISEDDVNTVMEQANCSRKEAEESLEESSGNIAEAILKLQGK
ncbi:nascent polypeptide-associated complex protein [Candidatus Woesearchaeota archaeon]|nr:nascent polypeptide-associated complex protein [Candidatus Woesearchaeota archaeon]MBI2131123.1 nascent polypeptide-associated complex protein [Candidatus Woesearchaeota archaeon]